VKRLWGVARSRGGRFAVAIGLVVAIVVALAAPGFACDAIVKASTNCSTGSQVITWTISSDRTDLEMDITHALASIGTPPDATFYPTTGWAPSIAPGGSTTATTSVPLGVTGTITLNVYVSWPAILATQAPKIDGLSIVLNNCAVTTTTPPPTTATTATTTTHPTSTTYPQNTSTTYPQNTSTTYPQNTSTTYPQNTSTTYPQNTSTTYPQNTSTTYPQNTSTTYPQNTSTTYPQNTSTTYAYSTSTTYPHDSTTTTCAPSKNTHKKTHKKSHKSASDKQPAPHPSRSAWWPAAWFA